MLKALDDRYQVQTHLVFCFGVSAEITSVGERWLSSCSFRRASLLYRPSVFGMRACQLTSHVCTLHNREQGILVLQEKVCSVISIIIPAIF